MEAKASVGATQPKVAAVQGFSAQLAVQLTPHWVRKSSFKKVYRSERPVLRGTGCEVQELWEIAKKQNITINS